MAFAHAYAPPTAALAARARVRGAHLNGRPASAPGGRRAARMSADARPPTESGADGGGDGGAAASRGAPAEPYSGFFADMKRAGLSEEEMYAQAAKAASQRAPASGARVGGSKSLLKPDGTPYAPWMGTPAEYDASVIKSKTDARGRLAADPQLAELSGVGLSWRMLGDELELRWSTGSEEGNAGFIVSRRAAREEKWTRVADFKDAKAELLSKGRAGGDYSFLVQDPGVGAYVYRVSDVEFATGEVSDLSQCLVDIDAPEDSSVRNIALAVLVVVLAVALAAGLSLDPLSTT